jgi:transcription termination factor Rho
MTQSNSSLINGYVYTYTQNNSTNNSTSKNAQHDTQHVRERWEVEFYDKAGVDEFKEQIKIEVPNSMTTRMVDLFCPIFKGMHGIIAAPAKVGKTSMIKELVIGMAHNNPEMFIKVVNINERVVEAVKMRKTFLDFSNVEVIDSTHDEDNINHTNVAFKVLEDAIRLVIKGKDVVIFLDSLTKLVRAFNELTPNGSKILSGGITERALDLSKSFLTAARPLMRGGSLTIIATALINTNSTMDDVIYQHFKALVNMEIVLSKKFADERIYPAMDIHQSSTREYDSLVSPQQIEVSRVLLSCESEFRNILLHMKHVIHMFNEFVCNNAMYELG